MSYPQPLTCDRKDDFHGEVVADPYRALEDLTSPETLQWMAAQTRLTESVLSALPGRAAIAARLAEIGARETAGVPFERGGRWFQRRRPAGAEQDVLYVLEHGASVAGAGPDGLAEQDNVAEAPGRVLLDPMSLSADGSIALVEASVSPDGTAVAYATSMAGSDWLIWRVRDVATGADRGDVVRWSKDTNAAWHPNGSGFFYTRLNQPAADPDPDHDPDSGRQHATSPEPARPEPASLEVRRDTGQRAAFHRLGTSQEADEVLLAIPDAWHNVAVSSDGCYLMVTLSRGLGSGHEVRVLELASQQDGFSILLPGGPADHAIVATRDNVFYVLTDEGADRRRIVAIQAGHPAREHWREIVPEGQDTLLEAHFFGGRLVCHYLRDACSVLRVFSLDGRKAGEIEVPAFASLSGSAVSHEAIEGTPDSDVVHFATESFTAARSLWRHDLATGETTLVRGPAFALDPAGYLTERVFVTSGDGTRVPVFLTRGRDVPRDSSARVLLYGYGGVGASFSPAFAPDWAVWLERGGVLALACLRGGGEYGRGWYHDGRREHKQHAFDDFSACLRWLATSGWSRPDRIGISGGSNGGLLVGATLNQHPELFGAAVAYVGVFDMLRFHLFTAGWLWKTEYGDPDDPQQFAWLRRYSPLHNVKPARYPATLLTTGDHDDRVVPWHTLKFGAALQAAQAASEPILIRIGTGAGHGHGKAASAAIAEAADCLAFLEQALRADGAAAPRAASSAPIYPQPAPGRSAPIATPSPAASRMSAGGLLSG
ncbi:MAG TPA: prolyl oligopeptidase family serine peptidase [Streptosporangiaceae bacterium]